MNREKWTGFKFRNKRYGNFGRNKTFWDTVFTAIAVTVVKDLSSNNSKILNIARKVFKPEQLGENQNDRKILKGEYSVLENDSAVKE
ncbi:hypothetical protein ACFLYK_04295 [Candidatus Cloacimonadota bacterium]